MADSVISAQQQFSAAFTETTSASPTFTYTNSITAGGLLVVVATNTTDTATINSVTDTVGDTGGSAWSTAKLQGSGSFLSSVFVILWRSVGTSPGAGKVVTVNWSASGSVGTNGGEYKAADSGVTWALDGTPTGANGDFTSANPAPGNITTASASSLVIGFAGTGLILAAPTAATNYTARGAGGVNGEWQGVLDRITTASGTYNPSWVITGGSEIWVATGAAWKATYTPAGGGVGPLIKGGSLSNGGALTNGGRLVRDRLRGHYAASDEFYRMAA